MPRPRTAHHVTGTAIGAAGLLLTLATAGCGSSTGSAPSSSTTGTAAAASGTTAAPAAAAGIPCSQAGDVTATPMLAPPADLPVVPGGHVYLSKGPFGKTSLFFEAVDHDPTDLDGVRNTAADLLVKAGYTLTRKDQEEGSEAEAHLTGAHDVGIQVIQLCTGKVRVKYTLG